MRTIPLLTLIGLICLSNCLAQPNKENDILISFVDTVKNEYGYKNLKGEIVIPSGRYAMCFTDTFRTYAIVLSDKGIAAIDRQEKYLYNVYPYDNGPDYVHEGLFRIVEGNKVGFADAATGAIVIKPQYDCAEPFEDGKAKVSFHCLKKYWINEKTGKPDVDDPHLSYESDEWFYIDKTGNKILPEKN